MAEDSVSDCLLSPHPMDVSPLSQHGTHCSLKEGSRAKEKGIFQPFCEQPVRAIYFSSAQDCLSLPKAISDGLEVSADGSLNLGLHCHM